MIFFSPHFVLFVLPSSSVKRQCKKQIKSCDKFLMNLKRCHDPRRAPVNPPATSHQPTENPSTAVWHFVWPINANEPDIYSRLSLVFFTIFSPDFLSVCVCFVFLFSGCKLIFFIDFYGDFLGCLCGPDGMRLGLVGVGHGTGVGCRFDAPSG